jgi:hypothetical protein
MPLFIKEWGKAGFMNWQSGRGITLPFAKGFAPNDPVRSNHISLSQVGRPLWYIYISHDRSDPADPAYPHSVEIHDNDDFVTLQFGGKWSGATSLEGGQGPIPTEIGRHHVRFVLLNRDGKPLLSQGGDYYVDNG